MLIDRNSYETPDWLFSILNDEFNFTYDLAASEANKKIENYFSSTQDSLIQEWHLISGYLWLNPPYSPIDPWILKAQHESNKGAKIVMLIPPLITKRCFLRTQPEEIRFLIGRINFFYNRIEQKGNRFDSCIMIFDKDRTRKVLWQDINSYKVLAL